MKKMCHVLVGEVGLVGSLVGGPHFLVFKQLEDRIGSTKHNFLPFYFCLSD
jgi:hypothetical protein